MKGRNPQLLPQTGFQESVRRRLLLAAPLIFICGGFGKRGIVPSGRAASNPAASSQEAPQARSERRRGQGAFWNAGNPDVTPKTLRKETQAAEQPLLCSRGFVFIVLTVL